MASNQELKHCSFSNCQNNSIANTEVKFFRINTQNVCNWKAASQNEKLLKLSNSTLCRYKYYICSDHFNNMDYRMVLSPFKSLLKKGAIPKNTVSDGEFHN